MTASMEEHRPVPSAPALARRGLLKKLAILVPIVAFLGVLWFALGFEAQKPSPLLGRSAPDFTLPLFSGGELRLSSLRGRVVLVNFWASWCLACRQEAPYLEQAWRRYRDQGLVVLGVNIWDTDRDARAYIREFGHTFPNGPDRRGTVAIAYGVRGVPESYFIDRRGVIAAQVVGPLTPEKISRLVEPLLLENAP